MVTFSIQNKEFGDQTLWALLKEDPSALKVMIMSYKEITGAYEQEQKVYTIPEVILPNKEEINLGSEIEVKVNFNKEDFTLTEIDSASWYLTYVIIYSQETVFTGSCYKIEGEQCIITTDERPVALLQKWINIDAVKVDNDLIDEHKHFYIGKDRKIVAENSDKFDNVILTRDNESEEITWRLPRYYDGIDLTSKHISIYYIRPIKKDDSQSGETNPQGILENLSVTKCDTDYIWATWIVTDLVTKTEGTLTYAIVAEGDGLKDEYFWQSYPSTFIIEAGIYGNLPIGEEEFKFIDKQDFRNDFINDIDKLNEYHEQGKIKWQPITSLINSSQEV